MPSPSNKRKPSPLTAVAPLFAALNWVAFTGWCYVLYLVSSLIVASSSITADELKPVWILEAICVIEVFRIALGDLPGNLVLGAVLHAIRLTAITKVLPHPSLDGHWSGLAILFSWSATEVSRYPMYMFPQSSVCRSVRMIVPLITFPIGAFAEFQGAFIVFRQDNTEVIVKILLSVLLFVNGVLGPSMAYPALLKKGLPVLGLPWKKDVRESKNSE